jgi:hypothetical protein
MLATKPAATLFCDLDIYFFSDWFPARLLRAQAQAITLSEPGFVRVLLQKQADN